MASFEHDVLVASVAETLASLRAALAALTDPEQADEARVELARLAAINAAASAAARRNGYDSVPQALEC